MKRGLIFFLIAAVIVVAVVLLPALYFFSPAQWMAQAIARASRGQVELADTSGSFWSGRGTVVVGYARHGAAGAVTLPGQLSWQLSPSALLSGTIEVTLSHPSALAQPLWLRIDRSKRVEAGPATLRLPAALLTGVGAPWNTLKPGGDLVFTWDRLSLDRGQLAAGVLNAEWQKAASSLTPIAPFGHYRVETNGVYPGTQLKLATVTGPLEMTGSGTIDAAGKVHFKGSIQPVSTADAATRAQLSGVISLLGRRTGDGAIISIGN